MGRPWGRLGLVAVVASAFASYLKRRFSRTSRLQRQIPCAPGGKPVLGHVEFLANKGRLRGMRHQVLADALANTHPHNGLARIALLGRTIVLVGSPEAQHQLVKQSAYIPKPSGVYAALSLLGSEAPSILMQADQDEHRRLRQHMSRFFTPENVESVYKTLQESVARMTAGIANSAAQGKQPYACIDAFNFSHKLVDDVVRKVFFQTKIDFDLPTFLDTVTQIGEIINNLPGMMLLKRGLWPGSGRCKRNYNVLRSTWQRMIAEKIDAEVTDDNTAFWACLRRAFPNARSDPRQYESFVANVALVYGAGLETTAGGIAMTIAALAAHPESMHRLEQELDAAGMLASPDQPQPELPTPDSLRELPFLEAVVHESLRMYPPVPAGVGRMLDKDVTLKGQVVPAGTYVGVAIWAVHYDTEAWGEDAAKWRPGRWLEGRSITAMRKDSNGHQRWLPFAQGAQNCIGQHLALMEMKMSTAVLVGQMRIALDTDKMTARTPEDLSAGVRTFITMQHHGGVHLRMTPRVEHIA